MIKCQTQRRKTSPQNYLARGGGYDDDSPLTAAGLVASKSVEKSADDAAKRFAKPQNYTGNRKLYDSPSAKRHAKSSLFSSQETVKDPYTDAELTLTIAEAKRLYGSDWQKHLAESDHILAIERIHEAHKNNPFITNENIRNAANSPDNMEVTSRAFNNAKRSRTNSEFMSERDYREEKGLRLSREKEQRAIQVGKSAEDSTNIQLLSDTAVNVTQTFHNAGTQAAQYGGVAALTTSGITNIIAVIKGEKSPGDALSDIAREQLQVTLSAEDSRH